ncbi:hypothetical protein XA68_16364 [Ophiocordyceps unilateralis]|uniref:Protein phosphatase n=1 Tax=Ophiocordyceps unilateralis TaxID=268505 RepID=A0A2A9PKJ2_OPHUN|nr:hypothetical protein XA68_16364 [Ophiocordyceps unilateralis]
MAASMAVRLILWRPWLSWTLRRPNCALSASHSTAASAPASFEEPEPTAVKNPATSRFTYHLGAAFVSKDGNEGHFYHGGRPQLRDALTREQLDSGEDAFFISTIGDAGHHSFGVADGVGGCKSDDVDPADFSRGICDSMARFCSHGKLITPSRLMQMGYDAVCRQKKAQGGSSTACVAVADPSGVVEVANLGDSGFLHLRPNAIIYRSKGQSHDFNTPYQLRCPKPSSNVLVLGDRPDDADVVYHSVRHGDILILATDGLLDNQYGHDILRKVNHVMLSSGAWQPTQSRGLGVSDNLRSLIDMGSGCPLHTELARVLTRSARTASLSNVDGPFAKKVQQHDPAAHYFGGKQDDITVVVGIVCDEAVAG